MKIKFFRAFVFYGGNKEGDNVTNATKHDKVAFVTTFANKHATTDMALDENNIALINYYKEKGSFTKDDLRPYFKDAGISLTDEALRIRIYRLKNNGILQSVARGKYTITDKLSFTPESNTFIKKLNSLFAKKYSGIDYCTWSTLCLNDFMVHQPVNAFYLFETDRDITENVFCHFKANSIKAFNNPTAQIMEEYVFGEQDVVVVKPLVSRAALIKRGG